MEGYALPHEGTVTEKMQHVNMPFEANDPSPCSSRTHLRLEFVLCSLGTAEHSLVILG
jgi:hypothetical protein